MNSKITRKELKQVFTRTCTLDSAWNYERQQNIMFCYTMIPVLRKLYDDKSKEMSEALKRHLEFMACTPHVVSLLAGICAAMEEENVNNENFDSSSISALKTSLMGPLAGIGDSFFWGTLLTVAIGISVSFSSKGSILGPILFLMIINIPGFLSRYYLLKVGYNNGISFFSKKENTLKVEQLSKSACILGLMVIGAMVATMIDFSLPLEIGVEGAMVPIQEFIDQIMPQFLPLSIFCIMYYILGKQVKTTKILLILICLCCVLSYLNLV